jgi:hypothetical protein
MSELLASLKSDLSDRRLLPIVLVLGLALVAAIAYGVLAGGGSGSATTPVAATPAPSTSTTALPAATQASADPHAALAETTDGARYQRQEGAHNPFVPLPSTTATASKTLAAPSTAGGSSSSSATAPSTPSQGASSSPTPTSTSTPATGGSTPAPAKPKPKKKPQPVYLVAVLFGIAPTTPGQLSQLTPYADLKRLEALPSASAPRIVFTGVSADGKRAIFTLAGEAILKGEGDCLPSASQCEAVQLAASQSEELSYLEPTGQTVTYELKVVSVAKREASASAAARLNRRDRAGQALMRRLDPAVLGDLRFSSAKGVLVYLTAPHRHHRHGS